MCKTIKQKVKLKAPPKDVYRCLVDEKIHTALTGKPARIGKKAGLKFDTFGGFVQGINVDMVPGKRLVQAWRDREFPEGIFSLAAFVLNPLKGGGTEVVLTHRGVPKDLIPSVEEHWRRNVWEKMRTHFSLDSRNSLK